MKPKSMPDGNSKKCWRNNISPEQGEQILNESRQVLKKWNTVKYLNCYTNQLYQRLWQKNGFK